MRRLLLLVALAAGCGGDDVVSHSAPIGINLKAKSDDVKADGSISEEKAITTESGNPWGKFIEDAEAKLGGPPGDIELAGTELLLAATSTGVTELREIFTGPVDVQFVMNDTNNAHPAATVTIDTDTAGREVQLSDQFDFADYQGDDLGKLLGGSFKVVVAGRAAGDFSGKGADADLQLTFTFEAFE